VIFLDTKDRQISLRMKLHDPEQQRMISKIFDSLKESFPIGELDMKVEDKRITPFEIGLLITIGFASSVSAEIIIRLLDRLWTKLTQNNVLPEIQNIDRIQTWAENYLKETGVPLFSTTRREDKGLYVKFEFEDNQGFSHDLHVSKTDFRILRYIRREEC